MSEKKRTALHAAARRVSFRWKDATELTKALTKLVGAIAALFAVIITLITTLGVPSCAVTPATDATPSVLNPTGPSITDPLSASDGVFCHVDPYDHEHQCSAPGSCLDDMNDIRDVFPASCW